MDKRWTRARREFQDIGLYLICLLAVIFMWWGGMGWRPSHLLSSGDGLLLDIPILKQLTQIRGNLAQHFYRPEWLGGVQLDSALGIPWIFRVTTWLGFSLQSCLNLGLFFYQSIYAFLAIKTVFAFRRIINVRLENPKEELLLAIPLCLIFAFHPALAWRIGYGHWILPGTLVYISIFSSLICGFAGCLSATLLFVTGLLIYSSFQTIVQQQNLYWMTLGLPVLLGVTLTNSIQSKKQIILTLSCIFFGALGLAMPDFSLLLENAVSNESARAIGDESMVYSYMTASLNDWLSSLTWGRDLVKNSRPLILQHEVNYPFGPICLVLVLFPWKRFKSLGAGLILSTFLIFALSTNLKPFSSAILSIIPILKSFRVPLRSLLLLVLVLPILAAVPLLTTAPSQVIKRTKSKTFGIILVAIFTSLFGFYLQGWYREVYFTAILVPLLVYSSRREKKGTLYLAPFFFTFLAAGSLMAFKERLPESLNLDQNLARFEKAQGYVLNQAPELLSPLVRADLQLGPSLFGNNLGGFLGLSSLVGYFPPPSRYLKLIFALKGVPFDPQAINIYREFLLPDALPILEKLYNVQYSLTAPHGKLQISPKTNGGIGPAWFASRILPFQSFSEIATVLKANETRGEELFASAPFLTTDMNVPTERLQTPYDPNCKKARVEKIEWSESLSGAVVHYQSPARCLLILSMNYTSSLTAGGASGPIFPVYGSLTGVLVNPDASVVEIRTQRNIPSWARLCQIFGVILIIFALIQSNLVMNRARS